MIIDGMLVPLDHLLVFIVDLGHNLSGKDFFPNEEEQPRGKKQKEAQPSIVPKTTFPLSANLTITKALHPNKVKKTTQSSR